MIEQVFHLHLFHLFIYGSIILPTLYPMEQICHHTIISILGNFSVAISSNMHDFAYCDVSNVLYITLYKVNPVVSAYSLSLA